MAALTITPGLWAVGALRPTVIESAEAGIYRYAVLLLQRWKVQRWHGISGESRKSANGPQGHEPQALNLSATWLGAMSDEQLRAWATQHRLQADTPIALYGGAMPCCCCSVEKSSVGMVSAAKVEEAASPMSRASAVNWETRFIEMPDGSINIAAWQANSA
jgi:hypothetical protein